MPETSQEFYDRAMATADDDGRLPLPAQAMWEIFPFEHEALRVKPLDPPVLPEPPRAGEGGQGCWRCEQSDEGVVWSDERWVLTGFAEPLGLPFAAMLMPRAHLDLGDLDDQHAADLGRMVVLIARAVESLASVGRVHVNKWGDGGAHLHVFLLGRPARLVQLRGSNLALWEEMFPRQPAELAAETLQVAVAALAEHGGQAWA